MAALLWAAPGIAVLGIGLLVLFLATRRRTGPPRWIVEEDRFLRAVERKERADPPGAAPAGGGSRLPESEVACCFEADRPGSCPYGKNGLPSCRYSHHTDALTAARKDPTV